MSQLSDAIAAANTEADNAISRVQEDVTALQERIAELEQNASTPEDLAALDTLKQKLAALDPVQSATLKDVKTGG